MKVGRSRTPRGRIKRKTIPTTKAERVTNDANVNRMVEKPMRAPWRI